jgi:hypothetical protein
MPNTWVLLTFIFVHFAARFLSFSGSYFEEEWNLRIIFSMTADSSVAGKFLE